MATATKNTFQDYDPRHRLTGAVVLILLAIVLLPMLLGKKVEPVLTEPDTTEPVVMEVTSEGKKVFVSRISSVADQTKDEEVSDEDIASSLIAPISPVASTKAQTKSKPEKTSQATTTKKVKTAKPVKKPPVKSVTTKKTAKTSVTVSGNWMLQVGVFSQTANANKKVDELKKKGFSARTSKVKTSKGTANKVWIGPYKDRKSAEKMQDRLLHKTRQRGIVVKVKP